jgi:hypothetical protein
MIDFDTKRVDSDDSCVDPSDRRSCPGSWCLTSSGTTERCNSKVGSVFIL